MALGNVPLARRNLLEDRRRFALAMLGIGSGLLMVLLMNAVFAGFTKQETAYLDSVQADVLVSQSGVRTMQMSVSKVPDEAYDHVQAMHGVAWVEPLRQMTTTIDAGDKQLITYLFGYNPATGRGGPHVVSGGVPGHGEVVLDRAGADQLGVRVGDTVKYFGKSMRVSGLTEGLTGVANTASFVTADDFAGLAGPGINYLLIGAEPGVTPDVLRAQLAAQLPNVTVQTHEAFTAEEVAFVEDLYTDVIRTMIAIGFVIALALVALSLSAVTSSKLRDYGVVKALGATRRNLVTAVATQAVWSVVLATALATAGAFCLAWMIGWAVPNVALVIRPQAILVTLVGALVVGAPGALLPLRRVLAVDPATAFRASN